MENNMRVVLVGFPIAKENATSLGIKIFTDVLEPLILKQMHAKFSYDFMKETINAYLKQDKILELIAQEYKIKPYNTYHNSRIKEGKENPQIQAQISKHYLDGQDGIIKLIKNNKIGKVGKGALYCTIEEAKEAKLTEEDLDLKKLWNELMPFIDRNTLPKKETRVKKSKKSKTTDKVVKEAKEYIQDCMDDKVDKIIEQHKSFYEE